MKSQIMEFEDEILKCEKEITEQHEVFLEGYTKVILFLLDRN